MNITEFSKKIREFEIEKLNTKTLHKLVNLYEYTEQKRFIDCIIESIENFKNDEISHEVIMGRIASILNDINMIKYSKKIEYRTHSTYYYEDSISIFLKESYNLDYIWENDLKGITPKEIAVAYKKKRKLIVSEGDFKKAVEDFIKKKDPIDIKITVYMKDEN